MSEAGTSASAAAEANATSVCATASAGARRMASKRRQTAAENKQRIPLTFSGQKAFAWAEGNPHFCPHTHCRKSGKCKGGPRGTFRKFGKPFCKLEAIAHQIRYRAQQAEMRKREREISEWL